MTLNHAAGLFFLFQLALSPPALAEEAPKPETHKDPHNVEIGKPTRPPTEPVTAPVPSDGWADGTGATGEITQPGGYVPATRSKIFAFQLNGILLLHSGGGNSLTGQFSWDPTFKLDRYEVRLNIGASLPKNSLGDLFLAVNYELLFRTRINDKTKLDIGGGGQTFTGGRGYTAPILSAQLSHFYEIKAPVNQIFLAYSMFFAPNTIHIFKAGIGFTL